MNVSFVTNGLLGYGFVTGGVLANSTPVTDYGAIQALQVWWSGQPALTALVTGGKLWHLEAGENGDVEPYLTYFKVSELVTTFTTGYAYYTTTLQINVHHWLPILAEAIAWQIAQALSSLGSAGGAVLTIHGTSSIHVLPDSFNTQLGEGLGTQGRDCWLCSFEIEVPWTH
jgi:hypothetical protein